MTGSNGQPRRIRLERNIYRRPTGLDSNYRQFLRADARTRTGDPFITSEVLYQLSYVGVCRASPGIGGLGCAVCGGAELPSIHDRPRSETLVTQRLAPED